MKTKRESKRSPVRPPRRRRVALLAAASVCFLGLFTCTLPGGHIGWPTIHDVYSLTGPAGGGLTLCSDDLSTCITGYY